MQNVEAMIAFYRALGFVVREGGQIVSVHFADQKINFHRPALWQSGTFTLRASAARPPCGDFCWVWEGSREALLEAFGRAGAEIEVEGERTGGRDGGRCGRAEHLHARPGRQPPGVHPLPVAGGRTIRGRARATGL
jgi:hypothetical protein